MVIAMENCNGKTAEMLIEKGHTIVPLYGHSGSIDIMIYQYETISSLMLLQENFGANEGGVLVICERNLAPEQVLKIIEQKNYGEGSILSL